MVSYGDMYAGRGQMSSTGADDGRAYSHARHLILMACTSSFAKCEHITVDKQAATSMPATAVHPVDK